jgi:hypothetical protein
MAMGNERSAETFSSEIDVWSKYGLYLIELAKENFVDSLRDRLYA